jgi:uncharacterized membrane protein
MQQTLTATKRIESIDVLRGVVMVIMALDHVRDGVHAGAFLDDPLNLATTTPALYFTRWITHFCAPVFIFLSGTSIYLQSLRKTKKELSIFILKRGLWLIVAEFTIIAFAWTFNPFFNFIPLQVIWAIGISMVILSFVIRLPFKVILTLGLLIVVAHNLLDIPESAEGFKPGFWWDLFHHGHFSMYAYAPNHFAVIVYPFVPWTGLMMLGYCFGKFFSPAYTPEERRKIFIALGIGLLLFFAVLRYANVYGDPHPWTVQKSGLYTFLSFINVHKYPGSLLYMCLTIGIPMLFLAWIEKVKNSFANIMVVYGRTAFFYYIAHLYLIHIIYTILFFARGHSMQDAIASMQNLPFLFVIPGEGYGLWIVYLVWIAVAVLLYPLCKWYDKYKTQHKEKWWLSYL